MFDDPRLRRVRHWQDTVQMPAYSSREAWEARAAAIRQRILFAAGLLPAPERPPLRPIVTGRVERDGYTIENVAFESFPGFYCTGNLYRPVGPTGRVPAVLTPHGHWPAGRLVDTEAASIPGRCISFARMGFVVFSPDMVGYNDSRQVPHRGIESPERWLWGIGALGLQLWNNIRALDYLCSLPDVDPARIACTGESGGGTQTFLLTAVDDRVRYVAPVNMLSAHYAGGCVCENAPDLRFDAGGAITNMEIVACAAPRPQLLVACTGDWTVNTPDVEFPAVRTIYELYGAAELMEAVQIDYRHNYNQASRQAVYGFLHRHLGGRAEPAPRPQSAVFWSGPSEAMAEPPFAVEPPERLRVFPEDTPLPDGALPDLEAVTAALVERAEQRLAQDLPHDAASLEAFRATYRPLLAQALAAGLPEPGDVAIDHPTTERYDGYEVRRSAIGTRAGGERFPALLVQPLDATAQAAEAQTAARGEQGGRGPAGGTSAPAVPSVPVLLVDGAGMERWFVDGDPARPGPLVAGLLHAGRTALLIDAFLTGGEHAGPFGATGRPAGATHFTGYNRVDAAERVQDVLTAVAALRRLTTADQVDAVGRGEAGLWCLLARALAPGAVRRLIADAGSFEWTADGDYVARLCVPHLRRVGGLATAAALAAPEQLFLYNTDGTQPGWLADLYTALGNADGLIVEAGPVDEVALT